MTTKKKKCCDFCGESLQGDLLAAVAAADLRVYNVVAVLCEKCDPIWRASHEAARVYAISRTAFSDFVTRMRLEKANGHG